MEITGDTLEERIKEETNKFRRKLLFHKKSQKKIDFITSLEWLQNQPCELKYEVSTLLGSDLTFHISNISIDDFTENILGPLHLTFGFFWEMKIEGDENDPVFVYCPVGQAISWNKDIELRVKEGKFKICKVVKNIISYTEPHPPAPVYNTRLVCE